MVTRGLAPEHRRDSINRPALCLLGTQQRLDLASILAAANSLLTENQLPFCLTSARGEYPLLLLICQ